MFKSKKKDFIKVLVGLLVLAPKYTFAEPIPKDKLITVNYEKVETFDFPESYVSAQGFAILKERYFVNSIIQYNDVGKTYIAMRDKNDFNKVSSNTNFEFGHASDMAYNSKLNQLLVVNGTTEIHILNADTFEEEKIVEIPDVADTGGYFAIAYISDSDEYALMTRKETNSSEYDRIDIYSGDLKIRKSSFFASRYNKVCQGISYHDGKIYRVLYEHGKKDALEPYYDGEYLYEENFVSVYDLQGNLENILYFPRDDNTCIRTNGSINCEDTHSDSNGNFNKYSAGEMQGLDFVGNKMYLMYDGNYSNKGFFDYGFFTPIFDSVNIILEFAIDSDEMQYDDNEFELFLYDGDTLLESVKNKGNNFAFSSLSFSDEKNVQYIVKTKDTGMEYKVGVQTTYDPSKNILNSKVLYDDKETSIGKISIENLKSQNVFSEENSINNPKTGNIPIIIVVCIGILSIIFSLFLYKKKYKC